MTLSFQGAVPAAGEDILAEPLADTLNHIITQINGNNLDDNNVDFTSADGIMVLAQAQTRTGLLTQKAALTVGVDDTGHDVTFFGATASKKWLWDESADKMVVTGDASVSGVTTLSGVVTLGGNLVSDTDSTDDLGTTSVRWANLYVDNIGDTGQRLQFVALSDFDFTTDDAVTSLLIDNTASDGDSVLGFQLGGTSVFTVGVDDGDSDTFKIGTTAIGTGTWFKWDGTTLALTGAQTISTTLAVTGTQTLTGVTTHGGNVVSDTDGTDDIGTTSVRWNEGFFDDLTVTTSVGSGTLVLAAGSVTDTSGAIGFGNENLSTTGTLASGVLTVTGAILPNANDGGALGVSGTAWSDLFLASGSVINFNAGDVTLTHSANTLTVAGGTFATAALTATSLSVGDGNITNAGDVALDTISADGSNITFSSAVDFDNQNTTNVDIDSGAIDGTTIGAASAAAGTFSGLEVKTAGSGLLNIINTDTTTGADATQRFQVGDGSDFLKAGWSFTRDSSTYGTGYLTWSVDANDDAANVDAAGGSADEVMTLSATILAHSGIFTNTGNIGLNTSTFTDMTTGLAINQGAADDTIFALKSSDIAGNSGGSTWGITTDEEDTFYSARKLNDTTGGLLERIYCEDANVRVYQIQVYGGQGSTTKSTSGRSQVEYYISDHDGAGSQSAMTADTNLFAVRAFDSGGASATKFLVAEDGDLHVDGSATVGTFDEHQDALLVRAFDVVRSPKTIIKSKWDEYVKYNAKDLTDAGILGIVSPEDVKSGHKPMLNVSQLQRLHNGAIWQLYTQIMNMCESLEDNIPALRGKLLIEGI
jgi:hypothetical protein